MKASDKVYEKSNAVETVVRKKFDTSLWKGLLDSVTDKQRQTASQKLLNHLSDKYRIVRPDVLVCNYPRPHATNGKRVVRETHGDYQTITHRIRIFNLTAVKHEQVSIKSFAETLLHEFMHHYDMEFLKLGATIHTAGFYKRISDLKSCLEN